jgi:hypothetical protein
MNLLGKGENNKMEEIEVAQMEISVEAHMKIRLSSATVRPKVQLDKIALVKKGKERELEMPKHSRKH